MLYSFHSQVVLPNGDVVKTASRARKSAAGFVFTLQFIFSLFLFSIFLLLIMSPARRNLVSFNLFVPCNDFHQTG